MILTNPRRRTSGWSPRRATHRRRRRGPTSCLTVPGRRITQVEPFAGHLVLHEWADAWSASGSSTRDGDRADAGLRRGGLLGRDRRQPRVRDADPALPLRVARHAAVGVRGGRRDRRAPAAQADAGARRLRPGRLRVGPRVGHRARRHVGARRRRLAAGHAPDGTAPLSLYGYGAYEASMPPWFSIARLSLLDRGVVWALAHPRGGGELGRRWYLDGKLLRQAQHVHRLHRLRRAPGRAGLRRAGPGDAPGRQRRRPARRRLRRRCGPDLFAGVVADVPFVDVVTTMSDPSLPLTVTEWDEWGDPRAEPYASYMLELLALRQRRARTAATRPSTSRPA